MDIAASEGPDALTMHRLAERLDCTPGALYRYFSSRDALLGALHRWVLAHLNLILEASGRWAAKVQTPLDKGERALLTIILGGLIYVTYADVYPREHGLLSISLGNPDYTLSADEARDVFQVGRRGLEKIIQSFQEGIEAGIFLPGPSAQRAVAFWAALEGAVQARKLSRSDPGFVNAEEVVELIVRTLLIGWGARRTHVTASMALARVGVRECMGIPLESALEQVNMQVFHPARTKAG